MGTAESIVLLGEPEARLLVAEINSNMEGVRDKALRLYEGEGWRVLGYANWRALMKAEFPHLSERTLYRELTTASVQRNLSHVTNAEQLNPRQAVELAKLKEPEQQQAAWQQAVESAPEGKVTAKHVAEVVKRLSPPKPEQTVATIASSSEPAPSKEEPRPRPEMWWACPMCPTTFNRESAKKEGWIDRGYCGHCDGEPLEEDGDEEAEDEEPFNAEIEAGALFDAGIAILNRWPRDVSYQPLIDITNFWLKKIEKLEAERKGAA